MCNVSAEGTSRHRRQTASVSSAERFPIGRRRARRNAAWEKLGDGPVSASALGQSHIHGSIIASFWRLSWNT